MNDTAAPSLPTPAELSGLQAIADMLKLLADAEASEALIKKILDASSNALADVAAARAAWAALDQKHTEHKKMLVAERAAHDEKLNAERIAHETECRNKSAAIADAETRAKIALADAEAARAHGLAMNEDLSNRLQMLTAASTAPLAAKH